MDSKEKTIFHQKSDHITAVNLVLCNHYCSHNQTMESYDSTLLSHQICFKRFGTFFSVIWHETHLGMCLTLFERDSKVSFVGPFWDEAVKNE